ncbi:uncharacterized protein [Hyperolius riggenbachi]|uniref:uncharacterized protein isoform X1 n=1 Tax=Hyperolius riggenbachi TaxID=752182 RepID=UPI0035A37821
MGEKFSPSLANLFMGWWEELRIFGEMNPFFESIFWYGRYIDDLLMIWGGPRDSLPDFLAYCNDNEFNLSFTMCSDSTQIDYLDLTLCGSQALGRVVTKTYRKACAGNSLLLASSCHPNHTLRAIPYGEMVRVARNCSDPDALEQELDLVERRLRERGYNKKLIDKARQQVVRRNRRDLLGVGAGRRTGQRRNLTFTTPYSLEYNKVVSIVKKYLPVLHADPRLRKILEGGCAFSARPAPTLRTRLSPSLFSSSPRPVPTWLTCKGSFRCGYSTCRCCRVHNQTRDVVSVSNGERFDMKLYINCNSSNTVYLITCTSCRLQYVGCTTRPLRQRISEHYNGAGRCIRNEAYVTQVSSVSKHFLREHQGDMTHFSFQGVDRVVRPPRGGDVHRCLLKREALWIWRLGTRMPLGLNSRLDINLTYDVRW